MKNRLLSLILILVLAISLVACQNNNDAVKPDENIGKDTQPDTALGIDFEQSLKELNANLDTWGGMFLWSPDGSYALFNAISSKPEASDSAAVILADVKNNKLIKLKEGYLMPDITWSEDSKLLVFGTYEELMLYDTSDNTMQKIADNGYMPQFSPDNSKFIYMKEGLWVYDMISKNSAQITEGKYDTAPIWFSDSNGVFYFRDNGKNLGDGAGNQQVMSVLDTSTKKFDDVDVDMKGKFRSARWLEQDKKLYIYAGWDDGHSYHFLNLDNNELVKDIAPQDMYVSFSVDDVNKKMLMTKGYTSSQVIAYDFDMKKIAVYDIYNDKEYPAAVDNLGITALDSSRMIYLHANLEAQKGALMISYLKDGKQTRVTDYGNYSMPFVSPDGKLLAYFKDNNILKIVSVDKLEETEVDKAESSSKAYNELLRMLPDRVGAEWQYYGFAEYFHTMRIDGINSVNDGKTQYMISGRVEDMSDGESKLDHSIYLEYLVSNEGIREIIHKGQVMPHKIKEFDILRYPLTKGNTWTQQVEINGQKTELTAEILEESLNEENNKVLKVQYTAKVEGMPSDTYTETRRFEESKGLLEFENTFEKEFNFGYHIYKFSK